MRRRRLLALCAAFVLLALAGGAGAAPSPVKRPPSLLWKSYPLKQRTAASQPHPLRPPVLAIGRGSSSGGGISPTLAFLALLGGAMLALTGVLAKSLFKDAATIAAARKGRSAEPEPESPGEAKPDMLVALHPTSVTTEEGPDPDEPRTQTPVPSRQAEEPEAEPPLLEVAAKTTPEPESEPDSKRLLKEPTPEVSKDAWRAASPEVPKDAWREISPREDTEVLVESCQIRLWRGYFSYQLYAASGSGDVDRALALSPYFRVKDPQAPGAAATAALREVLDQLEAEGWTVASEGQRWYSFELERPL